MRRWAVGILVLLVISAPAAGQRLEIPEAGPGRLRAQHVRYDARMQTFYAEGNVTLSIGDLTVEAPRLIVDQRRRTVQATGGVVVTQPGSVLRGRELLYEITPRLARVSGDVRLEHEGTSVAAGQMTLDVGGQIVRSGGGVRLARAGTTVTGDEMVARLRARQVDVSGHAVLVRPAGPARAPQDRAARTLAAQDTKLTADRLRFHWDVNEAEAEGAVVLTQPERTAKAGKVVYSEARGVIELTGDVEVEQRSGEWLVDSGVAEKPRDADAVKALRSPVRLWADRLVVRLETRDMEATGRVKVEQEGRLATGDRATYAQRDQTIVVSGNVRMREADGSWLRADRVVIAIADETFESTGNVETEFTVTTGK
jgi:lipopolysaccharide assembly outer membrane protein LptD (OstA)